MSRLGRRQLPKQLIVACVTSSGYTGGGQLARLYFALDLSHLVAGEALALSGQTFG